MGNLIIIPVYNENQYIEKVLKKVRENSDSDILVINDGSTDNSLKIIRSLRVKEFRGYGVNSSTPQLLNLLTHSENQGYGKSLIDGFDFAISQGYEYTVTMDCDEQHEPHLISKFLEEIKGFDVVSGSRYLKDFPSNNPPPQDRKYINEQITKIINRVTGYNLTDSFCGFKVYRVDSLKKLKLTEWGYGMPLQFWIQAWRNNLNVKEYPIERIYKNMDRSFGKEMDDPEKRLAYYKKIIEIEVARFKIQDASLVT
ncbi:MAG: glycosyltransferase family 2 protein [Nitrospinae bacterium]|nr:glycosyltransferase family 2 protein [Nitrospinota bacterium]MBI3814288.1 glycosyltransferase family 2 protein [Nitrospinota bacterium]